MPPFLDQIEHLSKPQLIALAAALREEILQLRPDESVDATSGDSLVYETRWCAMPLVSTAPKHSRMLLITDSAAAPLTIPFAPHMQLSCMEIDASLGWTPELLAERLRGQAGQFDVVAYYSAVETDASQPAPILLNHWCTALALATAVTGLVNAPRLWLITRRGQCLPDDTWTVDLGQAPLVGLGKSLSLEHPAAWGGCVDIDGEPGALALAFAEIADGADDEVAYRAGVRYVPLLERLDEALPPPAPLRPDGSYLVTGGLGGVGSALVDHLLARGVARVVVFARGGHSMAASEPLLTGWRAAYPRSRIDLIEVDLADVDSVSQGLSVLRRGEPVLRGIFHAAGSGAQVPLMQLDRAGIERVVCAKALGALYLDTLTRQDALDFQVYFSSIAGSWGTASMAPYAMANRFLDVLSAHRNRHGRLTRSIAWGPWASVGMIVKQNQEAYASLGLRLIEPARALHLLDRLIGVERAQVQAVDVDWPRYAQSLGLDKHLRWFHQQIGTTPLPSGGATTAPQNEDFSGDNQTLDLLRDMVAQLLGEPLRDGAELRPMRELGLTSLLSVELSQKIRHRLGIDCRATVVFDYPSLDALAKELSEKWSQANPAPTLVVQHPVAEQGVDERAIAIIGMACVLPGADSPEQLWERLEQAYHTGEDAIDRAPAHRFDLARYSAAEDAPGKACNMAGGYLDDIAGFDHALFHLSRREAQFMDPQQRLALETSWRAFEDAGIDPADLLSGDANGTNDAGVFFGIGQNEYGPLCRSVMDGEHTGLMPTGQSMNIIAGRIAHVFGLQGPAIAYDTACSSSLVALDAAVRHLREGRNALAVVGGVNALVAPESFVLLAKAGALSKHGRGAAFDMRADGYVRAEGCVVLVLKRLAEARADGDMVHAIIRGSAVNSDGRSGGLTAPSGRAQEQVMGAALRDAGVTAEQVALVEAHGTGTRLGDPIEYHALRAVYADPIPRTTPLQLGTLKSFIGHTESASGLAGLLKLVLSLRKRVMPAQLHYATLNPFIEASDRIEIPSVARPLEAGGRLLGAISSFGFSGTNAHVIVERGDDGISRRIPARPFARVRCWYSERSLPDSTGLAQVFGLPALLENVPDCYVRRWQAPEVEPGELVSNVLLIRPHGAGELYHRVREALLVRGVRIVEAGHDEMADLRGSFDRVVLCLEALQPLVDRATGWLDGMAGTWSAMASLLTAPVAMGHLLVFDASGGFVGDSVSQWSAVLACGTKERPGFSATLVQCEGDAVSRLQHHLDWLFATTEPVCVLSRDGVEVPRLERVALAPDDALVLAADRSYLVSGGLGGLGASLIDWLLERGARHIINLNRRTPNAEQAQALQLLAHRHGARIEALTVDLSDLEGMRRVLGAVLPGMPSLAGVFHCAGTLDEDLIEQQSWQRAQAVLRSKFVGAWNLHLTTLHQPLEYFVVFSSLTVLLGQAGQASYALANALAERLVVHRRALGLPGLAIQWGPWSGTGMASRAGLASSYRNLGLASFGAGTYLPVLARLLAMGTKDVTVPAQVGVFQMNWERYFSIAPRTPLCTGLHLSVEEKAGGEDKPSLAHRLAGVAQERRLRLLRDLLKQMVADCLNLASVSVISDQDGFAELGIDSLHSTFLQKRLENELRSALPPTTVFDHPTTAALAAFLAAGPLRQLFQAEVVLADTEDERMDGLAEEELAGILAEDIKRLNQLGATS
ncbi:SDR family NAD(P)-dependent oxidoreductase [Janthinobacterium lividum]|uniref:SDR family NAD(P)-dependent oxidoreductase n=1 Tax=Janthinobacterium lividum TaxID=29581 RepID=UPI000893ECF2|nr:SDR family NAD(P)-dependent oxidoreductase [Janthinobacterium lividum]MCC7716671.1 SDR family NAD(P)-dependent oxidoreductase [Janthinobacterium lividum]OEZ51798.1 erythronolide synthase, modules 5 and 6 [Janthinobacterium lividum]WQE31742.1 SDR family NAD(P)-dependent oxidoreductase [Janthinobacterium lividum]STS86012.1 Erythronolide synthase, modules 5 and 6 [Janthinobacterium lividum]